MVSRGLVDKTEAEYDGTVSQLLGDMRENEELPWEWVVDNSRWRRGRRPSLSEAAYGRSRQTVIAAISGTTPRTTLKSGAKKTRSPASWSRRSAARRATDGCQGLYV